MEILYAAWAASLAATAWLLVIGSFRMLAWRSGEVDHTPGMRKVALLALVLGGVAALVLVVLTVIIVVRG